MADYKKMYATLFNEITNTINRLQEIQQKTEDMYLSSVDVELTVIGGRTSEKGSSELSAVDSEDVISRENKPNQ